MIVIFSGLPGSGKSTKLADTLLNVLANNRKRHRKAIAEWEQNGRIGLPPPVRVLYTNLKFTAKVEEEYEGWFMYWKDLRELSVLRDVDVAIDEVATYFDARLWETLSLEMRRWLSQHRKFGIEIYGTTQDFAQVDKSFRRLTSHLFLLRKIIGSADIGPNRPAPKYIWGLVVVRELDPTVYDEMKSKFGGGGIFPTFMFLSRAMTEVFDTRAEIRMSQALPLKHLEKACELPGCPFHKTVHV